MKATTGQTGQPQGSTDLGYRIKYGCDLSADGRVSHFSHNLIGAKISGPRRMPEADIKRLGELLARLPDDESHLPPADRRLVFQLAAPNQLIARVYDRANAPDSVLEILRLTQSRIQSWMPAFPSTDQWTADQGMSALTLSPDRRQIVSAWSKRPIRFWDPDSHAIRNEMWPFAAPGGAGDNAVPISELLFSPDGSIVVASGDDEVNILDARSLRGLRRLTEPAVQFSRPRFTPDGHYLTLLSSRPEMLILETKTWQRVSAAPGIPQGVAAFFPAPRGQRSVYVPRAGQIALWDGHIQRQVAVLDPNGRIENLAYSPDGSMVAIATGEPFQENRIRIWKVEDGALVQELRPFEQKAYMVEGLAWWPDGRYVLAVDLEESSSNRRIGIWSKASGRHRGYLRDVFTRVVGLAVLDDGRLIAGSSDGAIRVWDGAEIIKQAEALDQSLMERERRLASPAK